MKIFTLLVFFCGPALLYAADPSVALNQGVTVETFEADGLLVFPKRWSALKDTQVAQGIYQVTEEDGNRFLRAYAEKQGILIALSHAFHPKALPFLRWRWRATQLPPGGDERTEKTNDSAAGVYVFYGSRMMPRAVKYVWSTTLPVGTRTPSPSYWRARIVVLRTGHAELGVWQQETVNLYQDYKELFESEPGGVLGIALITSSDSTSSIAAADYDDFVLFAENPLVAEDTSSLTE
ncbi:MAG TPA: DUF3047 domain-containing protein [Candidatus Binatia bacterium]|jgi:hypothetical protein|nr:DUF3047 domain-containing protein [Candidatus Binatia bacterium]